MECHPIAWEVMDRTDWIESRRTYIGASESGILMGIGRGDNSPYALWASKTQPAKPDKPTLRMRKGLAMERFISDLFGEAMEATGHRCDLYDKGQYTIVRHPVLPYIAATPDRLAFIDDEMVLVELKDVSAMPAREWRTAPPIYYQAQVQHQLLSTGLQVGYLAALLSLDHSADDGFIWYRVDRDDHYCEELERACREFWEQHIMTGTPPPVDETEACKEALIAQYRTVDTDQYVSLGPEYAEDEQRRRDLKAQISNAETECRLIENRIRAAIGSNRGATIQHDGSITTVDWKETQRGRALTRKTTRERTTS